MEEPVNVLDSCDDAEESKEKVPVNAKRLVQLARARESKARKSATKVVAATLACAETIVRAAKPRRLPAKLKPTSVVGCSTTAVMRKTKKRLGALAIAATKPVSSRPLTPEEDVSLAFAKGRRTSQIAATHKTKT